MQNEIKDTQNEIDQKIEDIKTSLRELQGLITIQDVLLSSYKNSVKSYFSRNVAELLDITAGEANQLFKRIKSANKCKKINRVFLEAFQIIEKPFRKNTIKKPKTNKLLLGAQLIGKLRLLNEQGIDPTTKNILSNQLKQLQQQLN